MACQETRRHNTQQMPLTIVRCPLGENENAFDRKLRKRTEKVIHLCKNLTYFAFSNMRGEFSTECETVIASHLLRGTLKDLLNGSRPRVSLSNIFKVKMSKINQARNI